MTPIYIGDDKSDEDVFRYLQGIGGTVLVGGEHAHTAAQFALGNTREVHQFLDAISKRATRRPEPQSLRRDEHS